MSPRGGRGVAVSANTLLSEGSHDESHGNTTSIFRALRRAMAKLRGARNGFQEQLPALDRRRIALVRPPRCVHRRYLHTHKANRRLVAMAGDPAHRRGAFHPADFSSALP